MKTFVSALTLGLIVAFSAPAFAAAPAADTSVSKLHPKAGKAKSAESKGKARTAQSKTINQKKPMY